LSLNLFFNTVKSILVAVFLLAAFSSHSQNQNSNKLRCDSYAPLISEQIATYGKFDDSMDRMIEKWQKVCGLTEPLARLLLLKALHKNDTNKVFRLLTLYNKEFYKPYKYKQKNGVRYYKLDTTKKIQKAEHEYLIWSWGYLLPNSNFDRWTKNQLGQPTESNISKTDIMLAARLLLAERFKLYEKTFRKSRDKTFVELNDSIQYKYDNILHLTHSLKVGTWLPFGSNTVFPMGFFINPLELGLEYKRTSFLAYYGGLYFLPEKKFVDVNNIERTTGRIWNYQYMLAHRVILRYPYEVEIAAGAGRSRINSRDWDLTNSTKAALHLMHGGSRTLRLRFYRFIHEVSEPSIRLGFEIKYDWVNYNRYNTLAAPVGKNYLSLGLVIRH
jgi:hypothetical protein